jgi:glutamyl-tRNA reductase
MSKRILVAGGTGNLGGKIVNALLDKGAAVSVLVRNSTDAEKINGLKDKGVQILEVEPLDIEQVTKACLNMDCIVSALAGLREVIIDTQKVLVDAAVAAKVPRFIPSDYALDFKDLKPGGNRNLDMRREFHSLIKNKPIQITSIFNGPFMDLLTGDMPLILPKINRILYWGDSKTSDRLYGHR